MKPDAWSKVWAAEAGDSLPNPMAVAANIYLDRIGCDPRWNDLAFESFQKYGEEMFGKSFDIPIVPSIDPVM